MKRLMRQLEIQFDSQSVKMAYNLLLATMLLTIGLVVSCSGEVPVYTDQAQSVSVKVKQEFILATPSNPAAGYQWRETYDKYMLKLVTSTFETSMAEKEGEEKVVLEQHFRFQALEKGQTMVQLDLMGPDLSHSWQNKTFIVTIR